MTMIDQGKALKEKYTEWQCTPERKLFLRTLKKFNKCLDDVLEEVKDKPNVSNGSS